MAMHEPGGPLLPMTPGGGGPAGGTLEGLAGLLTFLARTLTMAYSMREVKTKTRHTIIHTSMAFMYDTLGRVDLWLGYA